LQLSSRGPFIVGLGARSAGSARASNLYSAQGEELRGQDKKGIGETRAKEQLGFDSRLLTVSSAEYCKEMARLQFRKPGWNVIQRLCKFRREKQNRNTMLVKIASEIYIRVREMGVRSVSIIRCIITSRDQIFLKTCGALDDSISFFDAKQNLNFLRTIEHPAASLVCASSLPTRGGFPKSSLRQKLTRYLAQASRVLGCPAPRNR
jgi:hypothetical protein